MDLERIQQALAAESLAGWLFYDFRKSNPLAYQVLGLSLDDKYTRRWFYFVPVQGEPVALVSSVESHSLRSLPGERRVFSTWQELHEHLRAFLPVGQSVAMEYSPMNAIPYVSRVDAGTVELVRSFGVEVVSSANIAQRFISQLTPEQMESHREAGRRIIAAKDQLFAELDGDLRAGRVLDEYGVQQRFLRLIQQAGLEMPEGEAPAVAVNGNASNPHYGPGPAQSTPLHRGDLVLFDFWASLRDRPESIQADYTWMAFVGTREEIPEQQRAVFEVVRSARDSAIAFIRARLTAGERVEGREVDDVTRAVIVRAGYGEYYVHRTGHSIGVMTHGNGANIDNFETQDARNLLPFTCNSIEPGIYLPEFGVRTEVDLLILEGDVEVTGIPAQQEITPLL
jgi:Xaa-Pro dipeptidase